MNVLQFVAHAVKRHPKMSEFHSGRWLPAGKNVTFCWREDSEFIELHVFLYGHKIATLYVGGRVDTPSEWALDHVSFSHAGFYTQTIRRWMERVFSGVREFIPITVSFRDIRLPKRLRATGRASWCLDADARDATGMALYSRVRTITVNGKSGVFCSRGTFAVTAAGHVFFPAPEPADIRLYRVEATALLARGRRIVVAYHSSLCATTGLSPHDCMAHVREAALADGKPVPDMRRLEPPLCAVYAAVAQGAMPVHDALLLCTGFFLPPYAAEVEDLFVFGERLDDADIVEKIEKLVIAYKRGGVR